MHKFWELHEMFLSRFLIQDGYGKWIPRPPAYPTLDGLSFEEWDERKNQEKLTK
jgi:hypothetical protein